MLQYSIWESMQIITHMLRELRHDMQISIQVSKSTYYNSMTSKRTAITTTQFCHSPFEQHLT